MKMNRYTLAAVLASVLLVASCEDATEPVKPATFINSITITMGDIERAKVYVDGNGSITLPMVVGEKISLAFETDPADLSSVTFPEVAWESSDETVVTVDAEGNITAVAAGDAVVTVSPATVNMAASASLKIAVVSEVIQVTSIEIGDDHQMVGEENGLPACYAGETMTMTATVNPSDATYKTVLWSSSDESVAVVDAVSGKVTGVSAGEVDIIATALDAGKATASHRIYIDKLITPEGIRLTDVPGADDVFSLTDIFHQVEFTTQPEISTKSMITWESSDPSVASVDNRGKVTFHAYGSVTITATCPETEAVLGDGFAKSVSFTLNIPAGFYREHFALENHIPWTLNPDHVKSGATAEYMIDETTGENYVKFTPYMSGVQGRGDLRHAVNLGGKTYLSLDYPIICIRIDDVNDRKYSRNINIDTSGSLEDGTKISGNLGGNNNKWKTKYKCSDGSAILIYDLTTQTFKDGALLPAGTVATFSTFQIKYADINKNGNSVTADQLSYRMFWFHTFTSEQQLAAYLTEWSASTGITYE